MRGKRRADGLVHGGFLLGPEGVISHLPEVAVEEADALAIRGLIDAGGAVLEEVGHDDGVGGGIGVGGVAFDGGVGSEGELAVLALEEALGLEHEKLVRIDAAGDLAVEADEFVERGEGVGVEVHVHKDEDFVLGGDFAAGAGSAGFEGRREERDVLGILKGVGEGDAVEAVGEEELLFGLGVGIGAEVVVDGEGDRAGVDEGADFFGDVELLNEVERKNAWDAGTAMSTEQAIEYALQEPEAATSP